MENFYIKKYTKYKLKNKLLEFSEKIYTGGTHFRIRTPDKIVPGVKTSPITTNQKNIKSITTDQENARNGLYGLIKTDYKEIIDKTPSKNPIVDLPINLKTGLGLFSKK